MFYLTIFTVLLFISPVAAFLGLIVFIVIDGLSFFKDQEDAAEAADEMESYNPYEG